MFDSKSKGKSVPFQLNPTTTVMNRLYILANHLPYTVTRIDDKLTLTPRPDGFSPGLSRFYQSFDIKWIGQTGIEIEEISEREKIALDNQFRSKNCIPMYLEKEIKQKFLYEFCDNTLWPTFNYFSDKAKYENDSWVAYEKVNQRYADELIKYLEPNDIIWIHDYHLMLLPKMIKQHRIGVSIGYFQHIPFPSFEIFRMLPWRTELLEGLLGADLVGFHTFDYQRHFLSSVRRLMGTETIFNRIRYGERIIKVDAFPRGIDFEQYHEKALSLENAENQDETGITKDLKTYFELGNNRQLILSIDRLDYTKGIPDRIKAFENFLTSFPEYQGKVSLFLFVIPSRESVENYLELKHELDALVGSINGKFGTIGWMPIGYFYRKLEFNESVDLFRQADVALITPYRDGMNLAAKQYLACRTDQTGVLILSEMTGAAKELGECMIVNPHNADDMAIALHCALNLPKAEQIENNQVMQKRLKVYNEERWANDFIAGIMEVKELQESSFTKKVSSRFIKSISQRYAEAQNRIIFLDYDGTLTGFHKDPQKAIPNDELYSIIKAITADVKNTVVIISGRDKETLSKWFSDYDQLAFIAEHGVWVKNPKKDWEMNDQIDKEWMDMIEPVITNYVERTPRSFIEYKNYSLVWHYRDADLDLGKQRAWELKDDLKSFVANLNLEIMDGDKVIEIKNAGINKGRAALNKMGTEAFDFMLAIGDDWTDEFTFNALPDEAYTIKVGTKTTNARYYIDDVPAVRELLKILVGMTDTYSLFQ